MIKKKEVKTFPEVIKEIRAKNKLSQRALAAKFKIAQGTISKFEDGSLTPTLFMLKALRREFKFNVNRFLDQLQ